jgi:ABC-type oligopeptide transport system substrate-binding subunit
MLLLVSLSATLAGCGKSKVNSFTWFVDDIPTNLDPQVASDSADVIACTHLYDGLFRKDADGTPQNACCANYTVSSDGLTYTFTLESGLTYQEFKGGASEHPLTAQDFVFAFRRVFDAATASPYASSFAAIENGPEVLSGAQPATALGVSAPDNTTLVIRLSSPDENFLEKLTLPGAMPCNEAFFNSTKGSYGLSKNTVLTNGPFYLYNWTESGLFLRSGAKGNAINSLRLVQNTDASGMSPQALVENEKCTAALDTSSEPTALQEISYSDTTWCLVFNGSSVFSSTSLRMALAADAQKADMPADTTLYTAVDGIIPRGVAVDGYDYRTTAGSARASLSDPKALFTQALAEAGTENLKGLRILVPESADAAYVQALNSLWQEDYSLFFSIDTVEDETFWQRYNSGDYTMALVPLSLSQSDPLSMLSPFTDTALFPDVSFSGLMRQAASVSGKAKCDAIYQAERRLTDSCEVVPLYAQEKRLLVDPSIVGLRFDPYGPLIDVTGAEIKQ